MSHSGPGSVSTSYAEVRASLQEKWETLERGLEPLLVSIRASSGLGGNWLTEKSAVDVEATRNQPIPQAKLVITGHREFSSRPPVRIEATWAGEPTTAGCVFLKIDQLAGLRICQEGKLVLEKAHEKGYLILAPLSQEEPEWFFLLFKHQDTGWLCLKVKATKEDCLVRDPRHGVGPDQEGWGDLLRGVS